MFRRRAAERIGLLAVAALFAFAPVARADAPPYQLFTGRGQAVSLDQMTDVLTTSEVVFLGEGHDDPAAHRLENDLFKRLAEAGSARAREVALSLEMFETDIQPVVDEYLAGTIREQDLLAAARPWKNYQVDYHPLVAYARDKHLRVVAANAPHRYVSRVGRLGLASLAAMGDGIRPWLAPLPLPPASAGYAERFKQFARAMAGPGLGPVPVLVPGLVPVPTVSPVVSHQAALPLAMFEAQCLRDATMASRVAGHLNAHPQALVLHVTGAFHAESRQGTPEFLAHYRPGTRALVVTVIRDGAFPAWTPAMAGKGDFVAVTAPH